MNCHFITELRISCGMYFRLVIDEWCTSLS